MPKNFSEFRRTPVVPSRNQGLEEPTLENTVVMDIGGMMRKAWTILV